MAAALVYFYPAHPNIASYYIQPVSVVEQIKIYVAYANATYEK